MTLFTNPNFIDHIVKSQAADSVITQDQYVLLQTLVEMETRLLIETALKFMRIDRRDSLNSEDVSLAARQNMHGEMVLTQRAEYESKNQQIFRIDKTYASPQALFEQQMKILGTVSLQGPKLKGQWIYLKGRVPTTSDNLGLKTLAQLNSAREHEAQEKKKLFNIIKDESISLLTKEQAQYFRKTAQYIVSDVMPSNGFIVEGNSGRLLPHFLALVSSQLNETAIKFLLKVLGTQYLNGVLEFHLKRVLNILLAYKGEHAFEVGKTIADIVYRYSQKYPVLLNIFENYEENSYSTFLKKIAFQLKLGVSFEISPQMLLKCKHDCEANDPLAILAMRTILLYSGRLQQFRQYLYQRMGTVFYWMPCSELKYDPYLGSL